MSDRDALITRLLADSEEFRKLRQEHQGYEKELEELKGRPFLSADQQWRVSEVKKLKLMAKDRMEAIIRQASQTHSSQAPA
ncbi:MAG: YdcH family protein [Candidatus Rokubacteria bacterium]|nr:YdcH family protein [Candidatus Rokubacteria bacterium]